MKTHFNLKLLIAFTLLFKATSAYPASLAEICSEYRQDHEKIITPEASHHKEQYDEFSTGLLWKIETDEESGESNYLFGTMHSQDRAVTQFPPGVRLALAQSNSLIIESVFNEESNKIFLDSIFSLEKEEQDKQKLSDLIEAPIYQYLEETLPDYGVPLEKLPNLKPWAAFILMGKPKPVNAATLDMALIQTARSLNKSIISLETMEELLEPMENLSINDQIIILNDTVCNHKQIIRDSWELVQLYLARDLAGMMAFNEQPHFDEDVFNRYIQGILYKRNERMLERIIPYIKEGSAFIAVGALHLAGAKGLLQKLRERNYKITRVY